MKGMFRRLTLLAATFATVAFLLSGCSDGKDGAAGPAGAPGATGATGPAGPAGPVSLTNESCVVCHNANDVAGVEVVHSNTNDVNNFNTRSKPRLNERNFYTTITKVEATAGNLPKITFNVKIGTKPYPATNTPVPAAAVNYTNLKKEYLTRIVIADLVPANTATVSNGTWGSDYFENWAYEAGPVPFGGTAAQLVAFDDTDAANGNYSITLPQAWGVASVPVSGTSNGNNKDYNPAHPQRVYVRVAVPGDSTGTTDANKATHAAYLQAFPNGYSDVLRLGLNGVGNAAGIKDIASVPAAGASATLLADTQKMFVTVEACYKCHGPQINGAGHGGGYQDTLACVLCHSPLSGTVIGRSFSGTETYKDFFFPRWIHGIHAAQLFKTDGRVEDFTEVTFPQEVSNCVVCHTASGKTLGTGDMTSNWKNNPTPEVCGSCHQLSFTVPTATVRSAATAAHGGGAGRIPSSCVLCHDAAGITASHTPAAATKNVPEYDVTLAITPPATGTFYVAGETPTVTVTLKDHLTAAAVPAALYTAAKHAAGTTIAGSLAKASLYVYGPRAKAKPVLTKSAVTLSAAGVPTQAQPLFVDATNANITTSAAGFSYKLSPITADMAAGTYMVRFIAQNYGYVSDTNYKIDSVAFQTIKIGQSTDSLKVAGNACLDCHGTGTLGAHDARHSVVFDTDQCLSCHDQSGNYADPIHNRVHAIHSASGTGDLHGISWKDVTYPQGRPSYAKLGTTTPTFATYSSDRYAISEGAPRCITCHTSGNTSYKTIAISRDACIGCHADKNGATAHFLQMGGQL